MARKETAFTLIELLIVVAIIAILAAIAIPNFQAAQIRSRLAHSVSEQRTYRGIHQMYLMDYTELPGHYDGMEEHCPYVNVGLLSGPLTDPFLQSPNSINMNYWQNHEGMYHSTPISSDWERGVMQANFRLWKEWDAAGKPYVIYGEGPACASGHCNGWMDYATSNGLRSLGIIVGISARGKGVPRSNMQNRECL